MKNCKRIVAMLLCLAICLGMIPSAFASQETDYHDPAEHWVEADGRTNEMDANAVVTHGTTTCHECGKKTLFVTFRVPEYTRDGVTAASRNIAYSDGTSRDGSEKGEILDGTPGVDAYYTGYHWTKAVCTICGTLNSNSSPESYGYGKNVYLIYDCAEAFTEVLPTAVTYEPVDANSHMTTTKTGTYCCFCFGTNKAVESRVEYHNMKVTAIPQMGNQRFAAVSVCADCGYTTTESTAAKSVVASYFGVADGEAHTISVTDLSEDGVMTTIRYGTTADACTMTTAPAYTQEGQYTVYYEITYAFRGESMTENGVAYVWLRPQAAELCACGCGEVMGECTCDENGCSHDCSAYVCDHDFESTVIQEADCGHEGKVLNICLSCNFAEVIIIPKGEHSYTTNEVPATCTTPGYTVRECATCGERIITNITAILPHAYEAIVEPATCETGGRTLHLCSGCGASYMDTFTDALGHDWDEGKVLANATCTGESVTQYTCKACGVTRLEGGNAKGHTPGEPADCVNPQICTECGAILELAKGHDMLAEVTPATCTTLGYTTYSCANCDLSYKSDYTEVLGHDYQAQVTDPTCLEGGYTTYTCSHCGDSFIRNYTEPLGHEFGEGVKITDATCNGEGVMEYDCIRCDYHELHAVSPRGHVPGEPATCSEPQLCVECGAVLAKALGHSFTVVETPATCTEMGYTTYTCDGCDLTFRTDYTLPTGHNYESVVTAPTCLEGGYTTITCANCGDSYVTDYTEPLGHAFDEGTLILDSACAHEGVIRYTCVRCDYSELRAVEAKGHTPGEPATCTAPQLCTACGAVLENARGHAFTAVDTPATCTEMGYTTYICDDCGISYATDYTLPTGHTPGDWVIDQEPTYDCEGSKHIACEICGEILETATIDKLARVIEEHPVIFYGYPNGTFGAERDMARSEAAAIFARLLAAKNGVELAPGTTQFNDVPANAWYSGYVRYLAEYGIVVGTGAGKFSPTEPISRAEFTAIAVRFFSVYGDGNAEIMEQYNGFNDVSDGYWAAEYIRDAARYGWITGYGDNSFAPAQSITRAEVATVMMRLLGRTADRAYIDGSDYAQNLYSDLSRTHWAFYDILEASIPHDADMTVEEIWVK